MDGYINSNRLRPRITSLIVNLNIAIFILWLFSDKSPGAFMMKNFLVSWDGLSEGRYWTLLTSVFSHVAFFHIFLNMYVLRSFGPVMEAAMGRKSYLWFYLSAGVIASLCHCLVSAFLLGAPELPALGASGAISGVVLLFAFMFPKEKILFFALIPAPAIWAALLLVGMDLWGLLQQAHGGGMPIGYGAHLGGALTGFIYYLIFIRRRAQGELIFERPDF